MKEALYSNEIPCKIKVGVNSCASTAFLPSEPVIQSEMLAPLHDQETAAIREFSTKSNIQDRFCNKLASEQATDTTAGSSHARNAANWRQSRRKQHGRADSMMSNLDKKREKNRVAAAKCRSKQKASRDVLREQYEALSYANKAMKLEMRGLRDQHFFLRMMLLEHDDCRCDALQSYSNTKFWKSALAV